MDRQEKIKTKEGSENGSENGSNEESDSEEKVCTLVQFIHLPILIPFFVFVSFFFLKIRE